MSQMGDFAIQMIMRHPVFLELERKTKRLNSIEKFCEIRLANLSPLPTPEIVDDFKATPYYIETQKYIKDLPSGRSLAEALVNGSLLWPFMKLVTYAAEEDVDLGGRWGRAYVMFLSSFLSDYMNAFSSMTLDWGNQCASFHGFLVATRYERDRLYIGVHKLKERSITCQKLDRPHSG